MGVAGLVGEGLLVMVLPFLLSQASSMVACLLFLCVRLWEKGDGGDRLLSWGLEGEVGRVGLPILGVLTGECSGEVDMSIVMVVGESLLLIFLKGWAVGDWVGGDGRGLVSVFCPLLWGWVSSWIQLEGTVDSSAN